jgi:hypothetical protein
VQIDDRSEEMTSGCRGNKANGSLEYPWIGMVLSLGDEDPQTLVFSAYS